MQLKNKQRVTAYLSRRCTLFSGSGQSRIREQRRNCGKWVVRAGAKEILFDQESRSALQAGIDKLTDAVGVTLGPRGNAGSFLSLELTEIENLGISIACKVRSCCGY